jgi:hypothetical protein
MFNKVEGKEQFCVEVWNRFAALEDLDAEVELNSAWETIGEKKKVVGLERGPLSLVSTTEELLDWKVAAPV